MKFHIQTKFHNYPNDGDRGNCMQVAVACLLGLEIEEVPNFIEQESFWGYFKDFLDSKGYAIKCMSPSQGHPDGPHICFGPSCRGVSHAVIYWGSSLYHDPHPSDAGLESVHEINWIYKRDEERQHG